jgi:2,3-dihydroxy-2,3-dihydro-p-cumate dehydrogenase
VSGTLSGRTAVVTGAASGIGLGIITRLIADGAAVFAATRSKEDLEGVSEHAAIAGGGVIRPTLEHTEESLRATVDNNLWTTIYSVRAALPHKVSRGHGRIVNIGADSVRTGLVDHAMYNAAKGGVHAMVTGLAREFAAAGVTANTVAPCYVRTPELAKVFESGHAPAHLLHVVEEATAIVPIGRPVRSGGGRCGCRLPCRRGQPIHHRTNDLRQRRQQHGLTPFRPQRLSVARRPHRALRCAGPTVSARPGSKYVVEIDETGSVEVSFADVAR